MIKIMEITIQGKVNLDKKRCYNILFPASCNYWRWGSGGRQENINAICILALNHINDKVWEDFICILYLYIMGLFVSVQPLLWHILPAFQILEQCTNVYQQLNFRANSTHHPFQVFLILWWWFLFITLVAFIRIFYRALQCKWVKIYFKKRESKRILKIHIPINQ